MGRRQLSPLASLGSLAGRAFDDILAKLEPAVAEAVDRPAVLDEQFSAIFRSVSPGYGVDSAVHLGLPGLSVMRGWSLEGA
ncbi:hypothetical protein COUCH_10515 [Couchioplanes caeruleus]|uniref:hypothetical protein n=1 Tax=Couchioplanes caeruleus TaxID=56438 RepID=UPI0020BEB576|nr:hypothetical protein [Couchioplanes caeruleus]UQU66661.1 hypothetical protein COUCH_10515 [Couchioplanes caeruleus]